MLPSRPAAPPPKRLPSRSTAPPPKRPPSRHAALPPKRLPSRPATPPPKRPRWQHAPSGGGAGAYAKALASRAGAAGDEALSPLAPPMAAITGSGKRLQARPPRDGPLHADLERQFLPGFVANAADSVPKRLWDDICRHVSLLPSGPVVLTLGTACSGSEFYLTCLPFLARDLAAAWAPAPF